MSETQTVETNSNPVVESRISSRNSLESMKEAGNAPPLETNTPEPIEEKASTSQEAAPNEGGDGELPEFAKRRLGREQKKFERETARLKAELEEARAQNRTPAPQPQYGAQSSVGYQDPLTGEYIDTSTSDGQAIFNYQQKLSQHLTAQEKQHQERNQKDIDAKRFAHFQDSFEDAKDRHSDFEKVIMASGMNGTIASELSDFPDPGELGYYLASNPREVDRLQKLPAYEMKRELARHMAEMVSKNNITRTPPPVKTTGSNSGTPAKTSAHKSIAELKAERRAQLSGESRRRR
jgi:hypothetical protein